MLPWLALAALSLLFWLVRYRRSTAAPRFGALDLEPLPVPGDGVAREMVQDPVCEAFVAKTTALTTVSGGRVWFFCSPECYRGFLLRRPRAAGE